MAKKTNTNKLEWSPAPEIKKKIQLLTRSLNLHWIKTDNIYCFRSKNSSSRAYARIWGLSRVWQKALDTNPSYIIEVLSEKFDKLAEDKMDEILLHELAHIPKNFSGSLLPHIKKKGKRNFEDRVQTLVARYKAIKK